MATLDDKLLGEKLHYYCSSSDDDDGQHSDGESGQDEPAATAPLAMDQCYRQSQSSYQTGPKGVVEDFRRAKQLEAERREVDRKEYNALVNRLAMTCSTFEDDRADKDIEALFDAEPDEVERQLMLRRFQNCVPAQGQRCKSKHFQVGKLHQLRDCDQFLVAAEDAGTVLIAILESSALLVSLESLAKQAPPQFAVCYIYVSQLGSHLTTRFANSGCPALLVYRESQLVANIVRLYDRLKLTASQVDHADLEAVLVEEGVVESGQFETKSSLRRGAISTDDDDSD